MDKKTLKLPKMTFLSSSHYKMSKKIFPETNTPNNENIKEDLILKLINIYDLSTIDIDCLKLLLTVFNDYNLIKVNIYNDFKFIDIIKLIYSKCNKKLSSLQKQKILDYINYDDKETPNIEYKEYEKYNKFNYNMSKLNDNIDFSILGTNIIRNNNIKKKEKKSSNYSLQKNKNNNIINSKNYEEDDDEDNKEFQDDNEFIDIEL